MTIDSNGLWVRFRVNLIPPMAQIGTIFDDLTDFFIEDVFRPATRLMRELGFEGDPQREPGPDVGIRADLSPELLDEPSVPVFAGSAFAVEPAVPGVQTPTLPSSFGRVRIEGLDEGSFESLGSVLADFQMTVNLTNIPEGRRLEIARLVQDEVADQGAIIYFEVIDRLVNGPGPSRPGQPPAMESGKLVNSMRLVVSPDGLSAAVGTDLEYAADLEFGTLHMAARPFLFPTFEMEWPHIERAITKAASGEPPDIVKQFQRRKGMQDQQDSQL